MRACKGCGADGLTPYHHWCRACVDIVRGRYEAGELVRVIAAESGMSSSTIRKHAKDHGWSNLRRPHKSQTGAPDGMRSCNRCAQTKPLEAFPLKRSKKRGEPRRISYCRPCEKSRLAKSSRAAMARLRKKARTQYERDVVRWGRKKARGLAWRRHARRVAAALRETNKPAPPPKFDATHCQCCGRSLGDKMGSRIYCSDACNWRQQRRKRRARIRRVFVENVDYADIYARDGGCCGICGEKVDRRYGVRHPRSGTLDHIVPVARGGEHSRRNVHLAHRECNDAKKCRAVGEQLRLCG